MTIRFKMLGRRANRFSATLALLSLIVLALPAPVVQADGHWTKVIRMSHSVEFEGREWTLDIEARDSRYSDWVRVSLKRVHESRDEGDSLIHELTEEHLWNFPFDLPNSTVVVNNDGSGSINMPDKFSDTFDSDIKVEPILGEVPEPSCGEKTTQEVAVSEGSTMALHTGNKVFGVVEELPEGATVTQIPCKEGTPDFCPLPMKAIGGENQHLELNDDPWYFNWYASKTRDLNHARIDIHTPINLGAGRATLHVMLTGKVPRSHLRVAEDVQTGRFTGDGLPRLSGYVKNVGAGTLNLSNWRECGDGDFSWRQKSRKARQVGTLKFRPTGLIGTSIDDEWDDSKSWISRRQLRTDS